MEEVHLLLGNEAVKKMISKQKNWLMQFLHIFSLFQGMHAQKRETRQHREYESNQWEVAHNITSPITRLMTYLSDGYQHATREELMWALRTTLEKTFHRCGGGQINQYPHSDPVGPIRFHQVYDVSLVDFKVAEEYVSLHFPLNWMLSLLVSKIVEKDRDKPTDWDWWIPVRELTILTCVDYPLRANVFCSQIRAKLWTRNGFVMQRQLGLYNLHFAHSKSCSDFICLQWAFAILPPETMLLAMLDRYDLVQQLTKPVASNWKHPIYRDERLKVMIEEFFQMFLHLMNERNTPLGESAESIIRREIAHRLIFKKLPYSEISLQVRQHTEVDVDDHFPKSLLEMAHFYPATDSQPGMFELKPEYYSLVDPHYRGYTRNQSVECEKVLLNLMASHGILEANRVIEPPARVLQPIMGPFAGLTKVLGTQMFIRVVFCAIRFSVACPSETILDQALYLCLIAVMDDSTKADFVRNARQSITSDYTPSLIHALLATLSETQFTSFYPKLRCVLSKMRPIDPDWFDSLPSVNMALSGVRDSITAAETEHRKALAKKRQMEVLNRMKLAQSKFQESHKGLMHDSESENDYEKIDRMDVDESSPVSTFPFPSGTCILCQEETNEDDPYGLPIMIHQSPLFRHTPLNDEDFVSEAADTPTSLDRPHPRPFGQANWYGTRNIVNSENRIEVITEKALGKGFPLKGREDRGLSATTCGHLLHYRCWESYFKSILPRNSVLPRNHPENVQAGEFLCPLCRALSNNVLPIVWKEGINRRMSSPVWGNLTLQNSLQSLQQFRRSSPTLQYSLSLQNLDNRVIDVLPRLFPSLYTENVHETDKVGSLKYNKQNDHGRLRIYHEVLKGLNARHNDNRLDADGDVFSVLLAGTITTLEIEQRGSARETETDLKPAVLGLLSSQDLMLLRVLAETVRTMLVFRDGAERKSFWLKQFRKHLERMYQLLPYNDNGDFQLSPLLETDIFERFVIASGLSSHAFDIGIGDLLLFHYVAEVTKICLAVLESPLFMKLILEDPKFSSDLNGIPPGSRSLLRYLVGRFEREPSERLLTGMYRMLQRFILPFLRKATIFTHVYEGIIFSQVDDAKDEPESDRLCRLLGLPTLADVVDLNITTTNDSLSLLVQNWTTARGRFHTKAILNLHHPAIFEPIGLPERFDVLLELASKYRCPKCQQVPDDPAMCLLCGEIVCVQSVCCSSDQFGEMNIHREEYKSYLCYD